MGMALGIVAACSGKSGESDAHDDGASGGTSAAGGISSGGTSPSGGASPGGSATTGGSSPAGGEGNASAAGGDSGSSPGGTSSGNSGLGGGVETGGSGTSGGTGGAGATNGGTGGRGGTGGANIAGETSALSFVPTPESLSTGVRYYTGSTPANRTSGPAQGPTQTLRIHNLGFAGASITASVSGADAARFEIVSPSSFPVVIAPSGDVDVTLRLVTASTALGTAPAQDDGATVLRATLGVTGGFNQPTARLYALVLTYVELEPTFGQILDAFPYYTSNLPNSLRNDANPNPATLPGVEAGTDEVNAPRFRRANATAPITLRPLARFSPPGLVPFGWYSPGNIAGRISVGTLGQMTDPHTNDKSRMLLPPLASGGTEFSPSAEPFGLWMAPAGVGLLASDDDDGFDGAHRMKIWTLRDANGAVRPNEYLIGGEEAANGDYQDYVFVVTNVVPVP